MPPPYANSPYLPTAEQTLLLRATLLPGAEAIEAWERWIKRVDLEGAIEPDTSKLLPRLHRNLHEVHGVKHLWMERFKGVRRQTLYKNHLKLPVITKLLAHLQAQGIPTMILQDAALLAHYDEENGLHSLSEFDILIPTRKLGETLQFLRDAEWTPTPAHSLNHNLPSDLLAASQTRHAQRFHDPQQNAITLHWHLLPTLLTTTSDDKFWSGATPIQLNGSNTCVLSPADQLLHLCALGAGWSQTRNIRWVADAWLVLQKAEKLDWERLLHEAQRCHVIQPLQLALTYLSTEFGAPIPIEMLHRLQQMPVPFIERKRYEARSVFADRRGILHTFWQNYGDFFYSTLRGNALGQPLQFMRFMQHKWQAKALWQVPLLGLSKGIRYNAKNVG